MLTVRDLDLFYGDAQALERVSLDGVHLGPAHEPLDAGEVGGALR